MPVDGASQPSGLNLQARHALLCFLFGSLGYKRAPVVGRASSGATKCASGAERLCVKHGT